MKVLLVNAKPALADALAACPGVEVVLVWPRRHDFTTAAPPVQVAPQFYDGGSKLNLRAAWQIRRIIKREQPDIVHAFFSRALAHTVMAATFFRRRPRIVSYRGIIGPLHLRNPGDWITYWHPLVDAHACESEAVRRALVASGAAPHKCRVTYNCIHETSLARPGRAGLRQFDVPQDAFVVAALAAMRPVKGIDLLLKAAIQCADLHDMHFVLFGRVIDPTIHALAADPLICDRVRLVGHRNDAKELVSGADVLVMPSRSEGVAHALLEGMFQGVCPVVTDVGGMKDVVRHERDGLVVPPENVGALAIALRRLHGDRALVARFAGSARRRVADSFTTQKMVERMLTIYRDFHDASSAGVAA